MTTIRKFIGKNLLRKIEKDENLWFARPITIYHECNESTFDKSFYDGDDRVQKKYMSIPEFNECNSRTLDELRIMTEPPSSDSNRQVILGTTEFLCCYVAYCVKYIQENEGSKLPFVFFAPSIWTIEANIEFIDCSVHFAKQNTFNNEIIMLLPRDKKKWITPTGEPRVTIMELFRIFKILGDVKISIKGMGTMNKVIISVNQSGGGRRFRSLNRNQKSRRGKSSKSKNINTKRKRYRY